MPSASSSSARSVGDGAEVVILVSEAVAQDLRGRFRLIPVGELVARGRDETIRAFRLLGPVEAGQAAVEMASGA